MFVLLLLAAAGILLTLGYRIRVRREWHLIAGFPIGNVRDPDGLGRWVGGTGMMLGWVTLVAAVFALARPDLLTALGSAYAVSVCAGTAVLALGSLRYL
jgi:hypothetical protein